MTDLAKRARRVALATMALALPSAAWAQLQSTESQPGGVEARPQLQMPGAVMRAPVPQAAPMPVPAAAATAAPKPVTPAPVDAKKAKDDGKTDSGDGKKKRSMKKAPASDGVMAPSRSAPPAPASEATPKIPGDETRPGGVERVPTVPQPKQ